MHKLTFFSGDGILRSLSGWCQHFVSLICELKNEQM